MSFDEMYDEMLHGEFSSHGKHVAKEAVVEPELVESPSTGRHAAVVAAAAEGEDRPRGFQRYRTAALVGAGGMACAAAGAFLGGLGGYFTISPAAAHPLAAPTVTQDLPLAQAITNAVHNSSSAPSLTGTTAIAAASFSKASGGLTQGIAPFTTLTSQPLQNLPVTGLPGLSGTGGITTGTPVTTTGGGTDNGGGGTDNGGGGTTGGGTGCSSGTNDLGLSCILQGITGVLSNLGSLGGGTAPGGNLLNGLVPALDGVVSDVTGTLANLTSILSIASLPIPGAGGTTVLAGSTPAITTGTPSTTGTHSPSSNPLASGLASVLNGVAAVASGGTGSTTPTIPSLPLPSSSGSSLPSLPVTNTSGSTTTTVPTVSTPTVSTSNGSTTINVPLPLPISVPTISIGGLSVGINSSNSGSGGLTLTLP